MLGLRREFSCMASDRIHCEILKRAAEVAGGEDKLAQHLDVRSEDMHDWVQGRATALAGIYVIALDILLRSRSADDFARKENPKEKPAQ
jgi:hypothetical protein